MVSNLGLTVKQCPRCSHVADPGMTEHDKWQGRGVGTALMAAACDLAYRWLPVLRIELTVYVNNTLAIALYEKFGFERKRLLRLYVLQDGGYVNAYAMARLRPGT